MRRRVSSLAVDNINATLQTNERGLMRSSTPALVSAVNGSFTVTHDLGETPELMQYEARDNVTVRVTEANKATWDGTTAALTGSAAGQVTVWFLKRL
jgi:hypothetical protein